MSQFHFLNPQYLILLAPLWGLVWWLLKEQSDKQKWEGAIEPRLLTHLLVQPKQKHAILTPPWHLGIVLTLIILVVSAPSWREKASAFAKDDTKIVLLVSVKKSMLTSDIKPSRLERASIKIANLLEKKEAMDVALIAYSGSAHVVLPLTKDHAIIKVFTDALTPDIMPLEGDNIDDALRVATRELGSKGGTVIVLTDTLFASLVKQAKNRGLEEDTTIKFWQMASSELSSKDDFERGASLVDGHYVSYTSNENDVALVSSLIENSFKKSKKGDKNLYENGGYILLPFIFLLMLFWARRGFFGELWRLS